MNSLYKTKRKRKASQLPNVVVGFQICDYRGFTIDDSRCIILINLNESIHLSCRQAFAIHNSPLTI